MRQPVARLAYVTLDVADLDRAAAFWSALLGLEVIDRLGQYAWLQHPHPGAVTLVLQQVTEPKAGKARAHVDLAADDPQAVRRRAVALGATERGVVTEHGYELVVLADPDGNEFCLIVTGSDAIRPRHGGA
jgi:catechol 2,3-dioxygenase-like lactoylglutathione lyase family enzyme